MMKPRADDNQPATKGDVRRAYGRNVRRFVVLLALFAVLGGSFAAYTIQQQSAQRARSHQQQAAQHARDHAQCVQRRHNLTRANAFYQNMADLEQGNRFIDASLRARRVALYRGLVYPLPKC